MLEERQEPTKEKQPQEKEPKEQRIRNIAPLYYSRKDILEAIYKFSKNREISPRYFEGFGKRPDSFQYSSDILSFVKKGATSFHCSEELWQDPLQISTDHSEQQFNDLRTGWDLIIDIDCPWIDVSKKAAQAIIETLESYNIKNIGIKFSGNKGFHIIIPWQAFPEQVGEIKTTDMFPEWPRAVIEFIKEKSRPYLAKLIKESDFDFTKQKDIMGIICNQCHNIAQESYKITAKCSNCNKNYEETFITTIEESKPKKCPHCKFELKEIDKQKFQVCKNCNLDSISSPDSFSESETEDIFKILGLDLLLVSPRHLFRTPYSLHEKTALASIVIDKNKLNEFTLKDADPMNVKPIDFMPIAEKDEARNLLIYAVDWQQTKQIEEEQNKVDYRGKLIRQETIGVLREQQPTNKNKKFEPIKIPNLQDSYYPPIIQKILKGMNDGKKRALFILLNFFRSLGLEIEEVEKKVNDWNKKNNPLLKQGYINAQLSWHSKHKVVMPPNFDNEIYKAIGVYEMDQLSEKVKNPVNYVVRKSGVWKKNR